MACGKGVVMKKYLYKFLVVALAFACLACTFACGGNGGKQSSAVPAVTYKVSFDSFLNWLKLGDGIGKYIKELFEEYISIPTLYLMGEDDKLFLPQVQQTVKNGGENVSLIVVPNAGHVCNVDNKRFFNQHSLEFLQSVGC